MADAKEPTPKKPKERNTTTAWPKGPPDPSMLSGQIWIRLRRKLALHWLIAEI